MPAPDGRWARDMSFDLLAPHYTWMERVLAGRRLQRARTVFLDRLAGSERILIAGVGHGHFLRACAERFPESCITSLDASAGMLDRARERVSAVAQPGRLAFVHARLPEWRPEPGTFDAIVTPFFLDCFAPDELGAVIATLAEGARERCVWLNTDFAIPAAGWRRQRARAIHAAMYVFFRRVTRIRARRVTMPDEHLRACGFLLVARHAGNFGLLRSDCWKRESRT